MVKKMTRKSATRIQTAEANKNDGKVAKNSFAARAQRTAAKPSGTPRPPNGPSTTGNPSGGGRGNNPPKRK